MSTETPAPVATLLRQHLGVASSEPTIVGTGFPRTDHANVQRALDHVLSGELRKVELFGVDGSDGFRTPRLSQLFSLRPRGGEPPATSGPVTWEQVPVALGVEAPCVSLGLYLLTSEDERAVIFVALPESHDPFGQIRVEVASSIAERAEGWVRNIRNAARTLSVYRGRAITVGADRYGTALSLRFVSLKAPTREQLVLPEQVIRLVERHTIGFARARERLRGMGRHLRRGLLLHGPPGTGKTLTATWVAAEMTGRTTFVVSGRALGLIAEVCALARLYEPSTVILEDVDLVAEERSRQSKGCNSVLFEFLNEMDGVGDDADILFLLTTNRPGLLEPALAARPGRIDQSIEIPLPDDECRRRLLMLYSDGIELRVDVGGLVERTRGTSAAFLRELLRRAALVAIDRDSDIVEQVDVDGALDEIMHLGGPLTKALLGASGAREDSQER